MLAISRALMLRPKLLLLDEPSFGLAPLMVEEIFRILRSINRNEGVGMLLVEQNAHIALDLADQAYLIETGCIVMGGPAATVAPATTPCAAPISVIKGKKCKASCTNCCPGSLMAASMRSWRSRW
jgi:ABC-type branched-subunit amino acid transport system ATPase component